MIRLGLKARLAAAGAVALALAACDDRGGRVDAPEPPSLADLSAMSELPYAEAARVDYRPPAQGYAWAERAYGLQRAVYDTPPDYGFDYDGVEPLVWETDDDWVMYAEPWDGGYRYYYYEPGAYYPYFVRDDRYGYGYGDGGVLVAVFDLGGRYLPVETVYSVAPAAGRYYARGHDLRTAAVKAPRILVTDQVWSQRAPQVIRTADPWLRAARDDRGWRAWRERDQDRELRRFEPEAERRAARTRDWRERDDRRERAALQGDDPRRRQQVELQRQAERRQGFEAERQQQALNQRREQAERQHERQVRMEQAEQQRAQQRAQVEQRQREGAQWAQEQRRQRAEQQRQAQEHERQQAEQAQHRLQQAEQQEQRRQQAQQQQRERAEQAQQQRQRAEQQQRQAERQRLQAQQHQQQAQRQQQARSAQQQGQPAASRERGGGHGQGRGPGHDRKD
jgi:hypothetical protein